MSKTNIKIFDTSLRDGEQCPGASMTIEEKILIAGALEDAKVDIIEAGFPASSPTDLKAVSQIAKEVQGSTVCALSRCTRSDIDKAYEALQGNDNTRLHLFISTSPLHMKYKLGKEPEQVLEAIKDCVTYARNKFPEVQWSCEDGTRSELEFLYKCFDTAIKCGAETVNIADTVGYILPSEMENLVRKIHENVDDINKVAFSVHCHNDLGNAVANSIASLNAGARQIECTINGIGERAGNASLEEVVMTLKVREDLNYNCRFESRRLASLSQLISTITGFPVPPNKAIVGSNAFAHESGIHQHGVLQHRGTYEIMNPEDVGACGSKIVIGKHSGKHAIYYFLYDKGYQNISVNQLDDIFSRFKDAVALDKNVNHNDLLSIAEEVLSPESRNVNIDKNKGTTYVAN